MHDLTSQEAQEKLNQLIRLATEERCQFRIASEAGTAVLLSEETYNNLLVTLELLSTPGMMESFKRINLLEEEFITE